MTRPTKYRWRLLLALLAGSAWLALFGDKSSSAPAVAVSMTRRTADAVHASTTKHPELQPARGGSHLAIDELVPRDELIPAESDSRSSGDLFAARNWTPAPPPMQPIQPPPPTAPPLPFSYVGKKLEAGVWEIYLAQGETTYIVREGGSVGSTYLVERIQPPTLTLKYQPLGQVQTLSIGEAQ